MFSYISQTNNFILLCAMNRECIHQVRDSLNTKTPKKRLVEQKVQQCISKTPCMEHAGSSVLLNISSRCLELKSLESKEVIARHDMPRISFASGGDLVCCESTPKYLHI